MSSVSKQFAAGNPSIVAGINGCELARIVLDETGIHYDDVPDAMYLDKSPEYWAGWALAYYQWFSDRSFMEILRIKPLSSIIRMYPVYHEMDLSQFTDQLDAVIKKARPQTRLRQKRENCTMSQAQLAALSDVPLRQIQLFEQRKRDINKTSAITLLALSKALGCRMEELVEK